jgi:Salmonella virulence plasmid 65kDa B protein
MPTPASSAVGGERENDKAHAPAATPATIIGAIQGGGEKFARNTVIGTTTITIPLGLMGGRSGFPDLALAYNFAAGNGPFGIGWQLNLAAIKRKASKACLCIKAITTAIPHHRSYGLTAQARMTDPDDEVQQRR